MDQGILTTLKTGIRELNLELIDRQVEQMAGYLDLVAEWNQKINLVSYHKHDELWKRHLLDSLQCIRAFGNREEGRLLDLGSGAGFPGIPLAIAQPGLQVTLLESLHKRAVFLKEVINRLNLEKINVINQRAEVEAHEPGARESYDLVTVRAVAALAILLELSLPLLKKEGMLIAMKGKEPEKELEEAGYALALLGGSYERTIRYQIEGQEERTIIVVKKVAATPVKYPRRVGIPTKRPLSKGVKVRDVEDQKRQ